MQPSVRSLEQILGELGSVYDPQIANIRQRQSLIPGQIAEEEKGLQAKQTQSFDDILGGARRRGLGFAGIPLAEQARYTSNEFLPAMARLRQSGREQAMSLEDAILGIQERRQGQALGVQQYEQQRFDQWRTQQEAIAEQRRQFDAEQAARKAAAAAQNAPFTGLFSGGQQKQVQGAQTQITPQTQALYNSVKGMLASNDPQRIAREFNAILTSAGRGNANDRTKLQLLYTLNPNMFNGRSNALKLAGVS